MAKVKKDAFEIPQSEPFEGPPKEGRSVWVSVLIAVVFIFVLSMFSGCDSDSDDPIYHVENKMIKSARSYCFSRGDVDYFTMEENEPELLVCKDGSTSDNALWYRKN